MQNSIDAMILAAGRGTRLQPLTDTVPKALVEVQGLPMLEHVALRLAEAGASRLIVNTHYLGDQVKTYLNQRDFFGLEGFISDEENQLLDTGGGLLKAAPLFRKEAPFFLHNVDVLCDADLAAMYSAASASGGLATLAVMARETSRYLLFDEIGLCGHGNEEKGTEHLARTPVGATERLGFCGIHVISPRIFDLIEEEGVFSIIPLYMRLASAGEQILPWRIDSATWIDIGTPEKLEVARKQRISS
ncbi:MAG: nucleotidyltransferase family protein [Ignavibacteriae bacterium]|nr:nucleotidyltransferase family protein [Ignavibacteriota bacterium]MCB9215347.1 nucleotidyltransferase family protein [Ignavibacteria bacterium]